MAMDSVSDLLTSGLNGSKLVGDSLSSRGDGNSLDRVSRTGNTKGSMGVGLYVTEEERHKIRAAQKRRDTRYEQHRRGETQDMSSKEEDE